MIRSACFLASFVLAVPAAAQSVLRVPADVPTVQAGIQAALDGDTVLVAPGTYGEVIDFLGKAITVASEGGAAVTILDGTGLFESVVTLHAGEGPGTVLRGFTVTGGRATGSAGQAGGISGYHQGLSSRARIEACVVRGNRTEIGLAGGITGSETIEDCLIEDNTSPYSAGGLAGAPVVRRCTIRGNTGYDAGGAWLVGGRIEDSSLVGNHSEEGTRGGGVYLGRSSAVLLRCLVAENTATAKGFYIVSSAGVYVEPNIAPPLVVNCTVVANRLFRPDPVSAEDCGGVRGPVRLVNSIVRGNDGTQVISEPGFDAFFCDLEGFSGGYRNFDLDPLFADPLNGDYRLLAGSPCIDRGAPTAPQDRDCTRADVGAFVFDQPCVRVRNGSGVNPALLSALGAPALGAALTARVDASTIPGASVTLLIARESALEPGSPTPWGELLIDGPTLFQRIMPSTGALDDFSIVIPNDASLPGREAHLQAAVVSGASAQLTNALTLHVGH